MRHGIKEIKIKTLYSVGSQLVPGDVDDPKG